jgi:hypothetical protein
MAQFIAFTRRETKAFIAIEIGKTNSDHLLLYFMSELIKSVPTPYILYIFPRPSSVLASFWFTIYTCMFRYSFISKSIQNIYAIFFIFFYFILYLLCFHSLLNNVASRLGARQRPQKKQLYDSRC